MKKELNLSRSTTYLNVPNMCRGQYKMCPNSGDLSLKGKKNLWKEDKLQATRILLNSLNLFKTLFLLVASYMVVWTRAKSTTLLLEIHN